MASSDVRLDTDALRGYLEEHLGPADTFSVDEIEEGSGNETYFVEWGDETVVLRRPPATTVAPELLHDVLLEYRVLAALEDTWVPTPGVVLACEDRSILGDEFYLMEKMDGDTFQELPDDRIQSDAERQSVNAEMLDTLAKIHNIDFERVGLGDLVSAADSNDRHLEHTMDQLDWAQERTAEERELTTAYEVGDWLRDNVPEQTNETLIHGDFRVGNLFIGVDSPPRVVATLDWELTTVGEPLIDLGFFLKHWVHPTDPSPVTADIEDRLGDSDLYPFIGEYVDDRGMHPDSMTRRELVSRYEKQTGIAYTNDRYHRAMGALHTAVLTDGLYRNYLEGSPSAKDMHAFMEILPALFASEAKQIIDGDVPL